MNPPHPVVLLAAKLRAEQVTRRTIDGRVYHRPRPWGEIRDELARLGFGLFDERVLASAVELVAGGADSRKAQALSDAELLDLDNSWREGWFEHFPGEPYPGLVEARRRIRAKLFTGGRA
jgi:hypothetical protein